MSHGYFYICDNCDKLEEVQESTEKIGTGSYATSYKSWKNPHQWFYLDKPKIVHNKSFVERLEFCSGTCVKEYVGREED